MSKLLQQAREDGAYESERTGFMRKAKYGFLWVTLTLFIISLIGQWVAGWFEYAHEQEAHNQPVEAKDYAIQLTRGTLENWQSEFLQLIWQVAGLSFLWYIGS